ncbi:MAG: PucR family transcriptional regulator [Thermoleophilaceae bacterium]
MTWGGQEGSAPPAAADEPLRTIIERVSGRLDEIGRTMVERYRAEMADYASLDDEVLYGDVMAISIETLRSLLANLERGELVEDDRLEALREGGARRVRQGVALDSLLHAYRIWGQVVWEAILTAASPDRPAEREAALHIAGRMIQHIDLVSTAVARAYLDEAQGIWSDRETIRRDLLEALVSGKADAESVTRQGASLRLDLREAYVAVVARGSEIEAERGEERPLPERVAMRRAVEAAKARLLPASGSLLVGVRQGEVVILYPAESPVEAEPLAEQCSGFAAAVARDGFGVGVGSWHPGLSGIATSYAESRAAVEEAVGRGDGLPVPFAEIMVQYILRSSPLSDRILADSLEPIRDYDALRGAELVATLRAYFQSGFNLTRSAECLSIHPNTVVYRLRRIRELTGRDPHDPDDLLLLTLGLKLVEP